MPKVPHKKVVAKPQVTVAKSSAETAPEVRIMFRTFECLVHLEQAEQHLNSVGIFPPGHEQTALKVKEALQLVETLKTQYKDFWAAEQKKSVK